MQAFQHVVAGHLVPPEVSCVDTVAPHHSNLNATQTYTSEMEETSDMCTSLIAGLIC